MSVGPDPEAHIPVISITRKRADVERLRHELGLSVEDVLAVAPKSDPFYAGGEADVRKIAWLVERIEALGIDPLRAHQRTLHYALVISKSDGPDGKPYGGNQALLTSCVKAARRTGAIPAASFPDRKSEWRDFSGRRVEEVEEWEVEPPTLDLPDLTVASYRSSVTAPRPTELEVQPVTVAIVCEKDLGEQHDEIEAVAAEYGCVYVISGGYTGDGVAYRLYELARSRGHDLVVFTVTDADGSGESMPISTSRHLEFLARNSDDPVRVFTFPVALTLEQVRGIEDEHGVEIPRADDVSREQGRVELNALPILVPGWLGEQVRRAVRAVLVDVDFAPVDRAEEEEERRWQETIREQERALHDISARARKLLDDSGVREGLAQLESERDVLLYRIGQARAAFELEQVGPDVGVLDEEALPWLLDPRLDYLEQLNRYREHEPVHRRRPPLTFQPRPGCVICGQSMVGKRPDALVCSVRCRSTMRRR